VPIVWIGVYPEPFLRRIEPSVMELLRTMEERRALTLEVLPEPVSATDAVEEQAP
jgi:hypothetical protein